LIRNHFQISHQVSNGLKGVPEFGDKRIKGMTTGFFTVYHERLAEQGDARAQVGLGSLYQMGGVVPRNLKTAVKWYRLAAKQGNADAQLGLGLMYRDGGGVPKNVKTGIKWLEFAANNGNILAPSLLGLMYAHGQGVPKNLKIAVKWYRLASKQGNYQGTMQLGGWYEEGEVFPKNYQTALKFYKLAGEQGFPLAQQFVDKVQQKIAAQSPKQPIQSFQKSPLEKAKEQCAEIGFTKGTEKFGDCVMKLLN